MILKAFVTVIFNRKAILVLFMVNTLVILFFPYALATNGPTRKGFIYFLPTRNFYVMVFGRPIGTFAVLAALRAAKEPSCRQQKHTPKNS